MLGPPSSASVHPHQHSSISSKSFSSHSERGSSETSRTSTSNHRDPNGPNFDRSGNAILNSINSKLISGGLPLSMNRDLPLGNYRSSNSSIPNHNMQQSQAQQPVLTLSANGGCPFVPPGPGRGHPNFSPIKPVAESRGSYGGYGIDCFGGHRGKGGGGDGFGGGSSRGSKGSKNSSRLSKSQRVKLNCFDKAPVITCSVSETSQRGWFW